MFAAAMYLNEKPLILKLIDYSLEANNKRSEIKEETELEEYIISQIVEKLSVDEIASKTFGPLS